MANRYALIAAAILASSCAHAGTVTVKIGDCLNATYLEQFPGSNPKTFPSGRSTGTTGLGIEFNIPSKGDDFWISRAPQTACTTSVNSGIDIKVSIQRPVTVYTLLNTIYGTPNTPEFIVEFRSLGGDVYDKVMIGGVDTRDYVLNSGTANTINGTTTRQWWTNGLGETLDVQTITLPRCFNADTLTDIVITPLSARDLPMLSGVTIITH